MHSLLPISSSSYFPHPLIINNKTDVEEVGRKEGIAEIGRPQEDLIDAVG